MNLSRILLLLSLLCVYALTSAATRDPGSYFFDQSLGDFREELQTARDEGKKGILIMFEMDECPFCHRMKTNVLNQVEVQDYFKANFLIFPVDIEGDVMITDFNGDTVSEKDFAFKQYRVRATPVFAFFDLEGNLVTRYTGATSDVREFLWLGEFVVDAHYKQGNFSRFKRARKQEFRAK
ncbi:MAG: thioredoxin family protein [Chromatiales bacterium]|jgi:thioredoxin-related protein